MGPILVFGHRNPDNDSICSAIAYAHLKNLTDPENVYVAARLGDVPRETAWAFERFGVEAPAEITHVHTRVRDVMTHKVVEIRSEDPMLEAGRLMREHNVRAVPVIGEDGRVIGLVSQRILAERYIQETETDSFSRLPVSVDRLVRVLDAKVLTGSPETLIEGNFLVGASEPETVISRIRLGDVLIVGDRLRTQPMALEAGVSCLIVTGGSVPDAQVVELARGLGATVMTTAHDAYTAARLISLARAVSDLMETDVLYVEPDTLLTEAAEDLLASVHREAVVIDKQGMCVGMLTRTDIARGIRRRVILVDHNEIAQSARGIEEALVTEIVDHHRVGDIQTGGPIMFLNLPVGATATIVAERYRMLDVEIPVAMAGLLLGAVLTDTVLLKSPTTTDLDRRTVERLAAIVEVDAMAFGMQLFQSRMAGVEFNAEKIVTRDLKEYRVGDVVAAIVQHEAVELDQIMSHLDEVLAAMEALREQRGYDLVLLMATDIVREGSQIMAVGKVRLVERALGISLANRSEWMPGVLSRKKQVAARLAETSGM